MEPHDLNYRILFVTDGLGNGGAERQLALLVKYLPPEWERCVLSLADGPFAQVIQSSGIQVNVCPRAFRFDLRPAVGVWRFIREWQPQVIHSWGWMSSMAAGPICKGLAIPIVDSTIRMGMRPPRRSLAQRLAMVWASRIVANSRAGLNAWKLSPPRGRLIYNGFDPERLGRCHENNRNGSVPFTIIMAGRMSFEKDFQTVIDAARGIAKADYQNWRFVLVGGGPDRERHIQSAADLIDEHLIEFPEPRLEVISLLNQADVGVLLSHPTIHEGCSNAIMEYMACGLPVVCSESGGNRELVLDGETGFVIPPRNVGALIEKLEWLKAHSNQATRMGAAGKRRIFTEFTVEKMVEQTVAVYCEAL